MDRTVVNVLTGQMLTIPFTMEEEAAFLAAIAPAPPPPAPPTLGELQAQLTALQAQIISLMPRT